MISIMLTILPFRQFLCLQICKWWNFLMLNNWIIAPYSILITSIFTALKIFITTQPMRCLLVVVRCSLNISINLMQLPFGCCEEEKSSKERKKKKKKFWINEWNDVNWLLLQPDTLRIAYMFEFEEWIENRFVCQVPTKLKFLLNQKWLETHAVTIEYVISQDARMWMFRKHSAFFYGAWVFIIKKISWFWKVKMTVKHIKTKFNIVVKHAFKTISSYRIKMNRMTFSHISYLMQIQSNQMVWSITYGHFYRNFKFNFNFILIKFIYIQFNMVTVPVLFVFFWQTFDSLKKMAKSYIHSMDHRFYLGTRHLITYTQRFFFHHLLKNSRRMRKKYQ